MRVCARVCVRACACVRVCARVCVHACVLCTYAVHSTLYRRALVVATLCIANHQRLINTEIRLHAEEKEAMNVPYRHLSDQAKKRCNDRGRLVWSIMEEAGLVLWDGDNLEDMYVNSMPRSEVSSEKSRHLSLFLPRGCCTREDVHDLLRDLVGNAEWPYISQNQMVSGVLSAHRSNSTIAVSTRISINTPVHVPSLFC